MTFSKENCERIRSFTERQSPSNPGTPVYRASVLTTWPPRWWVYGPLGPFSRWCSNLHNPIWFLTSVVIENDRWIVSIFGPMGRAFIAQCILNTQTVNKYSTMCDIDVFFCTVCNPEPLDSYQMLIRTLYFNGIMYSRKERNSWDVELFSAPHLIKKSKW
jgi:hypothetical protein